MDTEQTAEQAERTRSADASTLTFLMTDIEGSTLLWEHHGNVLNPVIERHDQIVRVAVEEHNGTLVKQRGEGDSTFSVFRRASDAVVAAVELQRALAVEPWTDGIAVRVRAALHTGPVDERGGDYYGSTVNRCARLRAIAHGGQAIMTAATERAARLVLSGPVAAVDLGQHRLKDLSEPENVFALSHPDLSDDFPPLRSLDAGRHNLPVQLTSFVGRATEITEVRARMDSARLVTLAGPGGVGKTRLALQIASEVSEDFADGVWLVSLAPVREAASIPQVIAAVVGVRERPGQPLIDAIADALRGKRALIVLDNCEHLIDGVAARAEHLLSACPDLRMLATSREPLLISGEAIWRVAPLGASVRSDDDIGALEAVESVALFVERARAVNASFTLTAQNAPAVVKICQSLDGIPLAIELAAAREGTLTPSEIAERLDDRFSLLTTGTRTAPERHRTLRAVIDWGHELLSEDERLLFRRLGVFARGFTLELAEQVCADDLLERHDVLDRLGRLVDKSFVSVTSRTGHSRYRLLETVHEYARERLDAARESDALRSAHLAAMGSFADEASVTGPQARAWHDRLDEERDNFRAALEWSTEGGKPQEGLALATTLAPIWVSPGYPSEARRWLLAMLDRADTEPSEDRALALRRLGEASLARGDVDDARVAFEEALEGAQVVGDQRMCAALYGTLGHAAVLQGQPQVARAHYEKAIGIARELNDHVLLSAFVGGLGNAARAQGDFPSAREHYREALGLARQLGDPGKIAVALFNLGSVHANMRDEAGARPLFEECRSIATELGDRMLAASADNSLAYIAMETGDTAAARRALAAAIPTHREMDNRSGLAAALMYLAWTHWAESAFSDARTAISESLELWRSMGSTSAIGEALNGLGLIARGEGDPDGARAVHLEALELAASVRDQGLVSRCLEGLAAATPEATRAAVLSGAAARLREEVGAPLPALLRPVAEAVIESARASLGDDAVEVALDRGRSMSLDEAVAYARS